MKWTPGEARLAFCVALVAIGLHHAMKPHGEDLPRAALGDTVTMQRTTYGWLLTDEQGRAIKATKVRIIHAENLE